MGFWDAVASAVPHANSLHLTPDRQPHQHVITQFLQARCSSWRPANSVKPLKDNICLWESIYLPVCVCVCVIDGRMQWVVVLCAGDIRLPAAGWELHSQTGQLLTVCSTVGLLCSLFFSANVVIIIVIIYIWKGMLPSVVFLYGLSLDDREKEVA